MKKKLILFATLVGALCSASVTLAEWKLMINNKTNFSINYALITIFCGRKEITIAAGKQGIITAGDLCTIIKVQAYKTDSLANSPSTYIERNYSFVTAPKTQEHNVYIDKDGDLMISSPTKGLLIPTSSLATK